MKKTAKPAFQLDENIDPRLRRQILTYLMGEALTDRERARLLGLPEGCRIRERAKILAPEKLKLGRNVWIGEGAMLDAQGGLSIGDNTQIGCGTLVWSHSSHKQAVRGKTGVDKKLILYKPTRIGKNCFIVGPSAVAAGVTIGDGAMVLPLTFVDRDVPAGAVVGGNIGQRSLQKRIEELEKQMAALTRRLAAQARLKSKS